MTDDCSLNYRLPHLGITFEVIGFISRLAGSDS